jgi:predicted metal-dependent phosphoesterase TrpH
MTEDTRHDQNPAPAPHTPWIAPSPETRLPLVTPGVWEVDLHSHTIYSKDCLTRTGALIERARALGLARIAVTEHNRLDGALAAKALAPDLVIVGEEIKTTRGEIIAYFVQEMVPKGLTPQETIRRLREQGAVISIPHPLDWLRRSAMGLEAVLEIIDEVDALEVLNARCVRPQDNDAARALAKAHGKLATAGSDAHTLAEVGRCALRLPAFEDNAASFLQALRSAQAVGAVSPFWPHFASTWAKVRKRIRPIALEAPLASAQRDRAEQGR